jgi:small subunit ribosomal protein S13
MFYLSGARLLPDEQVRIASTKIHGIGPKKAIQLCYRLGISGNIKINELTKSQIHQISKILSQEHVVHWELKRRERADIERLISISRYRGIRHKERLPLRGQRTHTNARTAKLLVGKSNFSSSRQKQISEKFKTMKQVCGSLKLELPQYRSLVAASAIVVLILNIYIFPHALFCFFARRILNKLFPHLSILWALSTLFSLLEGGGLDTALMIINEGVPAEPPAEPPAEAPPLQLNGLEEAAEILVLRGEIVHLLGHRIESQLEDNGVLDFYHNYSAAVFGDPEELVRQTAERVLESIEMEDIINIEDLGDFFNRLQHPGPWKDLDDVIKDILVPQPPLL